VGDVKEVSDEMGRKKVKGLDFTIPTKAYFATLSKKYVNFREFFLTNCIKCPFLHLGKGEWGCEKNDELDERVFALLFGGLKRTTIRRCSVLDEHFGEAEGKKKGGE